MADGKKDVQLTPDTGAQESPPPNPDDPQQIKSGSSRSPGGKDAPNESQSDMTQGQEGYPGPRSGGETADTGETPRPTNAGEV